MKTDCRLKKELILISGDNKKYIQDFEFVFDDLRVVSRVDIGELIDMREQIGNERVYIICDPVANQLKEEIIKTYPEITDMIYYAEDFFYLLDEELDFSYWAGERKIAFYGEDYAAKLEESCGHPDIILSDASELNRINKEKYYIIIAKYDFDKAIMELEEAGFKVGTDFMDGILFCGPKYSDMMKRTYLATPVAQVPCRIPYHDMIIAADFHVYPCCPSGILPEWGDSRRVYFFGLSELWHSMWWKIMRLSMANFTYCFCDWHFCSRLKTIADKTDERLYNLEVCQVPSCIQVELDYTCNLHCPSCRKEVRVASPERKRLLDKLEPDVISLLDKAEWVRLAGMGDVIASPFYQRLLYADKKRQKLFLITNGVLLTEDKFDPLPKIYDYIELYISIDAATKETYNKLRPGGNWEKLMDNLEMLAEKNRQGLLKRFRLQFVVQMDNYKEIPDFVRMGQRLGVSDCYFNSIRNWGFPEEEYEKKNILNPDLSIKPEVLEYLNCKEIVEAPKGFVVIDFVK
ncbi:MAG: radical SAM protein [Lachnospiraceae bacterium]|nr:radical SAM protein [Lachnospiraceae bacterium]